MKTNNLIIVLLIVAVSFLLGHTFANNQAPAREDGRTEEYLILQVTQSANKDMIGFILETEGGNEYEKMAPASAGELIKKLNSLNAKGFELFNVNYSLIDNNGRHNYTYIFKRKL